MADFVYPGDCELTAFLLRRAAQRKEQQDSIMDETLRARAARVELLLLDVDGVLTDGSLVYSAQGDELKTFNSKDGFGLNLLQQAGVAVGIITARRSGAVARRAADLGLAHVHQGARNKVAVCREIMATAALDWSQVAYMGDDWLDMPLLTRVGLAATVADAVPEMAAHAHFVSQRPGGRGAVRELCDLIIEARGRRDALMARYLERQ